jgi:hypothetical protein
MSWIHPAYVPLAAWAARRDGETHATLVPRNGRAKVSAKVRLDPPAQPGRVHQGPPADVFWQRGQKVFRRLGFVREPFRGARRGALVIAMRGTYARSRNSRRPLIET